MVLLNEHFQPEPKNRFSVPFGFIAGMLVFGLCGCLVIYCARAFGDNPMYFAERQLLWLLLGGTGFLIAALLPFSVWRMLQKILFVISMMSLLFVLLFGLRINGMRGWFEVCPGFLIQVSEFSKIAFLLYLSSVPLKQGKNVEYFLKTAIPCAVFCGLILLEPDMGSAFIYFTGFLLIYAAAGGTILGVLASILAFCTASSIFLSTHPYAVNRILAFLNPESDVLHSAWHIRQFQYALAQGGLTGSEHGAAVWANAYLPLPHTDSLYATIVETSGLCGGLIVLLGFLGIAAAFTKMSWKKELPADARLFIFGAGILYPVQALLHISVNTVVLPPTGVTLPLLSYGGSSLLSTMLALGIAFSALRETEGMWSKENQA